MPYSSGTYSLYTPGNPAVSLQTISAALWNSTFNDIASALSTCVLKNGSQTLTGNLPLGSFKLTQVGGVLYTVGSGLTATGADQAAAYAIVYAVNEFTTVGAGTGARLPASNVGMSVAIYNGGANALAVYPETGSQINAAGANNAISLATGTAVFLICVSSTRWIKVLSA